MPFNMTLPAVSKHLKVLEKAGLIERSRDAQIATVQTSCPAIKGSRLLDRTVPRILGRESSIVSTIISKNCNPTPDSHPDFIPTRE